MLTEKNNQGVMDSVQAVVIGRRPKRTLIRIGALLVFAAIAFVLLRFVVTPVHVIGPSMYPTFCDGGIKFLNRLAYLHSEPHRGDIVVIRYSGNSVTLVKRIVGLPGEQVFFQDGKFMVNGKPLDEPYLKFPCANWQSDPKTLGPDEYYVVGDNRTMPFRNHYQGAAERRRILGKILLQGS